MKKIVVLISGGGSNLEAIAKACQIGNIPASVELVISNQTDVKGLERAKKFHLMSKVIEHQKYNSREEFDQALLEQILPIEPDLVVLAGFMRILSKDFTDALSGKLINIHPSLLPNYPGLNTHKQAIENGDLMHGISVHYVNNELDGGPIITQGALKIDPSQSERKLINRIHKIEHMICLLYTSDAADE